MAPRNNKENLGTYKWSGVEAGVCNPAWPEVEFGIDFASGEDMTVIKVG